MAEMLHHVFLTDVHDQLSYDNWYSDDNDTAIATQDAMERDEEKQLECLVKSELLKHKVSLLCKALLQRKQSHLPRMQRVDKLLSLIDADESASIALFVLEQFSELFAFQLRLHSESAKSRLKAPQRSGKRSVATCSRSCMRSWRRWRVRTALEKVEKLRSVPINSENTSYTTNRIPLSFQAQWLELWAFKMNFDKVLGMEADDVDTMMAVWAPLNACSLWTSRSPRSARRHSEAVCQDARRQDAPRSAVDRSCMYADVVICWSANDRICMHAASVLWRSAVARGRMFTEAS